jgi:phosphate transport system protein
MNYEFDQELDRLRIDTLSMFYTVRDAVDKAMRAVRQRDLKLSNAVRDGDEAIDLLECQTEALGLRLLALKQPVARDLRLIMGTMRIASNLERIADEAVNIVDRNLILMERPPFEDAPSVWRLGEACLDDFDKVARSFADNSFEMAQDLRNTQDMTTSLHMQAFRDLTDTMIQHSRAVERAVQLSFISYSLKRICDRCVNISESVIFITKGLDVKHKSCDPQEYAASA